MAEEPQVEVQKKMTMILIAWLIGWTGLHRKMMGYKNWWVLLLLTPCFGIGVFWAGIDFWRIILDNLKMADGRDLEK
jgi:hypothetical protein